MGVFLILFVALITGTITIGTGVFVFIILQKRQKIFEAEQRKGKTIKLTSPVLGAFIAMICTLFIICIILVIAYLGFAAWMFKDFTLF